MLNENNSALYAVSVIYLFQITDYLQSFIRQIIGLESMMVSVERAMIIAELPSEKELVTDYDKQNGICNKHSHQKDKQ